ncbi:uncharacterized protein LOC116988578 [Amblyraja radiata]|uniref:uncharacterized protein LOC116988578 n=1 Tax=Amblyraja radiata TaxID=386614 RepID=UPI001401F9A3|nr:uncharacterized protein LOC116988578 [Amblyraja radiata]XP_032901311.1 uncharacterized protein LOC116988578 [Amblyraja radiata]
MEIPSTFRSQLANCLKTAEHLNDISSNGGSGNDIQTWEPGSSTRVRRRAQNFTDTDLQTLLNEMQPRRDRLLGVHGRKPQKSISRAMWREVAMALNATSLTSRTADQCRKKFNDLTRAGKEKLMHNAREGQECKGYIPNIKELTPYEDQAVELAGRQCGLAVVADGEIGVTLQATEPSQQWGPEEEDDEDEDDDDDEKLCFFIDYDDEEEDEDLESKPDRESLQLDPSPCSTGPAPSFSTSSNIDFPLPCSSSDVLTRERLDSISEEDALGDGQDVREPYNWAAEEDVSSSQRKPRRRMHPVSEPWDSDLSGTQPKRRMFNEHLAYLQPLRSIFEDVQHLTTVTLESTALICSSIKEAFASLQTSMEHVAASLETAAHLQLRNTQEPLRAPAEAQSAAMALIGERIDGTLHAGFQTLGSGIQTALSQGFQELIAAIRPTVHLVNGNINAGPSVAESNLPGVANSQDSITWQRSGLPPLSTRASEFRKQRQSAHAGAQEMQAAAAPSQEPAARGGGGPVLLRSRKPFVAQE